MRENITATMPPGSPITTKGALKLALEQEPDKVEFISTSIFHRSGAWFTLAEAIRVYGSVSVEVRFGPHLAVIEADRHPSGEIGMVVK
jgi:hypothetical protein